LQDAAVRLVSQRGLDHVTVEQLADAAEVSTRTFFNYFSSKEEALVGHDPEDSGRLREAVVARPSGEAPLRALHAVLRERLHEAGEERDRWLTRRAVVRSLIRSEPRLLAAWVAAWASFEQALVEGVAIRLDVDPDQDLYPRLVAGVAVAATRTAVVHWNGGSAERLGQLVDTAFSNLGEGLAAPVGESDRS
jgi:AcrR family transcriptional regulator